MDDTTKKELQAATFERLIQHLRERKDVQNIDLMNLAGFCRNCLSRWYREEAMKKGITILSYEIDINVGGKIAQLGSRLINGVAKKMSDYFFGRFADLVSPMTKGKKEASGTVEEKRVKVLKSNFLNKYIYSGILIFILLLVVIFYFVSR